MAVTLDQLLAFEGKLQPTQYKTKEGLLLWPVLRYPLFRYLNDYYSNFEPLQTKRKFRLKSIQLLLKATFSHNGFKFLFIPNLKYLYFGSGITNIKNKEGKYHNRVSDDLLLLAKKESFIIEQYNSFEFKYPRTHKQHAASLVFDLLYTLLIKCRFVRLDAQESKQITSIVQNTREVFNKLGNKEADELKGAFTKQLLKAKAQYFLFHKLYYLKTPQIVFVEDASYGSNSFLIKAAKDNGIKVGELQHGFVGRNHMAYNYADVIIQSSEYQQYTPDYFLTYGDFWSEEINLPSKKVSIGKPSIQIDAAKETYVRSLNQILFVSSGNTFQETMRALQTILNGLENTGIKLVFRPHPLENDVESKYGELLTKGMQIDRNDNVYDSIRESQCIIGDISTVLYEALAFENKIVISYRSAHNPLVTFPEKSVIIVDIDDFKEINTLLKNSREVSINSEHVWSKDWQNNFRKFLDSI